MPTSKSAVGKALHSYLTAVEESELTRKIHLCGTGAVRDLERKLKRHYGVRYALCVSNATSGLLAIALSLKLKRAEFVTTPYTYGATVSGWLLLGNKPVFADIDPSTLTLDHESVRRTITPKTKAILVSDIYGNPHDTVGMRKIADEYGLWYVSDSAQSLGASRDDMPAGALADALVVSFTVGKTVFAGEGGAILTNICDLYQKLVWFTQHPMRQKRDLGLQLSNEFALNARIHPLAAVWANASLEESLKKLQEHQKESFRIIDVLNRTGLTEDIDFVSFRIRPAFFRLTAAWKSGRKHESELLDALREHGLRKSIEHPPVSLLYRQPAFLAQYARRLRNTVHCPQAGCQVRSRFCLV
jgi:dTDP-4-amino-4,6-dideoxygalactose transaminase